MVQKKNVLFNSEFPELNKFFESKLVVSYSNGSERSMKKQGQAWGIEEFRKALKKYEPAIPRCGFMHPTQMPSKKSRAD